MITAYHRPQTLEEALALIGRKTPVTVALGGGTLLSHGLEDPVEVVDLQGLGLDQINRVGSTLEIGAMTTLQGLLENKEVPKAIQPAIKLEAPLNLRNAATVAGTIIACDGRSSVTTALLALDAKLIVMKPQVETHSLGDFLPMRARILARALVTKIQVPGNLTVAFDYVSRTPADKPIVCVALAVWPSGRARLAVGGFGTSPLLAMDGTETQGLETAARNAFHEASDPWGSAEYRMDAAATLTRRCLQSLAT